MTWQDAAGDAWPDRLRWMIDKFASGDRARFASKLGVHKETVRLWGLEMRPGIENLAAILREYPEVNPEWLVTGRGPRERAATDPASAAAADVLRELRTLYVELAARYGGDALPEAVSLPRAPAATAGAAKRKMRETLDADEQPEKPKGTRGRRRARGSG